MASLTELEGTSLGTVWRNGPCTAYSVMREFAASLSSSWSASAGAVYPTLRKLESMGLLEATSATGSRHLQITPEGVSALREWLKIEPGIGRVSSDPVRSRMFFVDAIADRDERIELITLAERETRAALSDLALRHSTMAESDPDRLASMGSIFQLRARIRWLRWLRSQMS